MKINNDVLTLSKNVRELRINNGLSIAQLAKKARISVDTISALEKGIGNPLIGTLYKLSIALKTKLYILCKGI